MAESAVEVAGLTKRYGELAAVDGISFSVRTGSVFAFLGPNGAGKTTTVEILEGLRRRTAGSVDVLGLDPWTDGAKLHRQVGVIPQDFHFFEKIYPVEAIRYYGTLFGTTPDAEGLLERVGLSDKARARFDTLSGGQKQKLGLALALANDPQVCFLDEPTTGLDPQARRGIWQVIRSLKAEGRTVFLTTHYLEEAELLADRVAIINHGKIIAEGTPGEIIRAHGTPGRLVFRAPPSVAEYLRRLGVTAQAVDGQVRVPLRDKSEAIQLLRAVESSQLPWSGFATEQDTLEDVFVRLVGQMDEGEIHPGGAGTTGAKG
ncbi:MAG TPA: ABC transporter ATP-binding protein [Thermoplasmata archaeon]|nr:ABC transporter ATP-binding protein [Thermoplasmata archaeon]